MDFSSEESGSGGAQIFRPGGVPVYGRVSMLVAEHLGHGKEIKGLRLWYRCASCHRTVRIEEEANHNASFHIKVICDQCQEMTDAHRLFHHKRATCPKLKTFCEYCSADTTLDEIESHYDSCREAMESKSRQIFPPLPPLVNIQFPPESIADDLVKLAAQMSEMSIGKEAHVPELRRHFQNLNPGDNFPVASLQKYKSPYGYKFFWTNEGGNEAGVAESEERRQHHQLNQQKKGLCKYFAKKFLAPHDKIKDFLGNDVLSKESEMMVNLNSPAAHAQDSAEKLGISEDPQAGGRPNGIGPKQYTRLVHDVAGSLCRQDARRFEECRQRQLMAKNVTNFNRRLNRKLVEEDQKLAIREAVALKKEKGQLTQMSQLPWRVLVNNSGWGDGRLNEAMRGKTNYPVPEKKQDHLDEIKNYFHMGGAKATEGQ